MTVRKIITHPHQVLRQQAEPVACFDDALKELAADMAETMYDAPGVGLAANQIGVAQRLVVIDLKPEERAGLVVLVNPKIVASEGCQVGEEGCLSVVDYFDKVERFERIRVEALDLEGRPVAFPAEDFFARVVQHELDHLDGVLFIDHLSRLKKALYKKRLHKMLADRDE